MTGTVTSVRDPRPAVHHWFMGTDMVHGVRLLGGKAEWYRNRFVGENGSSQNTNVGGFAGTTWAMVEAGTPPVELGYDLVSLGTNRFFGNASRSASTATGSRTPANASRELVAE